MLETSFSDHYASLSQLSISVVCFFFLNDTAPTEIYTLSLHDALPIFHVKSKHQNALPMIVTHGWPGSRSSARSEEHTSELQSRGHLVCRLLLEKKKKRKQYCPSSTDPTQVESKSPAIATRKVCASLAR